VGKAEGDILPIELESSIASCHEGRSCGIVALEYVPPSSEQSMDSDSEVDLKEEEHFLAFGYNEAPRKA
jgi:hypothetical protein